jgi:hypothetical protein
MNRAIVLAFLLNAYGLATAHADSTWCSRTGDCIVTVNVPPVVVRCDLQDISRSDPRCVGADRRQIFDADATVTPDAATRRRPARR